MKTSKDHPPQQEVLSEKSEGYNVITSLLSPDERDRQIAYHQSELRGETKSSIRKIGRLLDRVSNLRNQAQSAHNNGHDDESTLLYKKAEKEYYEILDMFGEKAIKEVQDHKDSLLELSEQEDEEMGYIPIRGDEGESLLHTLLAHSPMLEQPPSQGLSKEKIEATLRHQPFIKRSELDNQRTTRRYLAISHMDTIPEIPTSNIISASSFLSDWATGRGDGQKEYETKDGQLTHGKSIDAITDYATRGTELPPLENVDAFLQPNGMVLFVLPGSNHRGAAAIAKGQKMIPVKGKVRMYQLKENIL